MSLKQETRHPIRIPHIATCSFAPSALSFAPDLGRCKGLYLGVKSDFAKNILVMIYNKTFTLFCRMVGSRTIRQLRRMSIRPRGSASLSVRRSKAAVAMSRRDGRFCHSRRAHLVLVAVIARALERQSHRLIATAAFSRLTEREALPLERRLVLLS